MRQKATENSSHQELLKELALLRKRLGKAEQKRQRLPSRKAHDELKKQVTALTAEQRQRAEQLARLASELILTEQRERRRLAQMLHDHLQQLLVGAKYRAELLARRVAVEQRTIAEDIGGLLNESIIACCSLAEELSPPILHEADLSACLEWLVQWLSEKRGLIVALQVIPGAATVREDIKIFLFQAIQELLFNVIAHAGVTDARVEITRHDKDQLAIMVSDKGRGFNPEAIRSRTGPVAGRSGLVSIRERLSLLGGSLQIDSAPQKGSRFTLIVPTGDRLTPSPDLSLPPQQKEEASHSEAAAVYTPVLAGTGDRKRILLVDDHPAMRRLIASALDQENDLVIVGEAADGSEAVEKVRQLRPDLVLMDFSMPGMDGIEATRIIHAEFPEVRIIGLSVDEEDNRPVKMLEAGAAAYVAKCEIFDALLGAIRR